MKLAIVLGTRPDIIKLSPVIKELQRRKHLFCVIHTGQHNSPFMDKQFFEDLELPEPRVRLDIASDGYAKRIGKMTTQIGDVLRKAKPNFVLVLGDTITSLGGVLAAKKQGISVAHIEAGLRSHDLSMPEEINRILIDHTSYFLFPPTEESAKNLLEEGENPKRIFITGNCITDAVLQNIGIAEKKSNILNILKIKPKAYFLFTAHRAENVDNKAKLSSLLKTLDKMKKFKKEIVWPMHPRTKKMIRKFKLKIPRGIKRIEPIGFLDMLMLEKNASVIITDSGGIQEESCILKIPCVTIRENTERPETVKVKQNIIAGTEPKKIISAIEKSLKKKMNYENPYGDGFAAQRIISVLESVYYGQRKIVSKINKVYNKVTGITGI